MSEQLTLEEQIAQAKINERKTYLGVVSRAMEGERSKEIYDSLLDAPIFVGRDAVKLLAKIRTDYDYGKPTSARYVHKPENVAPFVYLTVLGLVEAKVEPYFRVFHKRTIVPK